MNKFLLFVFFIGIKCLGQNNLIVFTENAEPIQIEYQGKTYPKIPQSDVKLTKITEHAVSIKIIFSNKNLRSIDTTLFLYHPSKPIENQDVLYVIQKDNRTIKYLTCLPSSDIQPVIPEIDTTIQVKTREEKTVQKIIFLNDSTTQCMTAIDTSDFNMAIRHIDKTPNQDRKIVLIEQFIKHNCFNTQQAQNVIERVPFEVERVKIMKMLLSKLVDIFGLEHWQEYVKSSVAKESYVEYYQQQLYSLNSKALLSDSVFNMFVQKISALDNEMNVLKELKIILSHYSMDAQHIKKFLSHFKHDQYREEFLKCAFYALRNRKDFETLISNVEFKETKDRLLKFYGQQKQK